jgi:hypothetical protein
MVCDALGGVRVRTKVSPSRTRGCWRGSIGRAVTACAPPHAIQLVLERATRDAVERNGPAERGAAPDRGADVSDRRRRAVDSRPMAGLPREPVM